MDIDEPRTPKPAGTYLMPNSQATAFIRASQRDPLIF